ncbi:tRNA pseudouridine(55) synthase TruB [Rothia sp. CCM 9418]|uniref:tRNA pseudouridine(55) synthase TruB n=1 Tax=Rothia sp. CCM 9418 TaxID=3402661 RepID=UPI003AE835FF
MARRAPNGPSGIVVIDKPAGLTSHDVVGKVRRLAHTRRVGHAGTLDPMATGVLIVGVNKATKLLTWITGESKSYTATIRLGGTTHSDDFDGQLRWLCSSEHLKIIRDEDIIQQVQKLTGDIVQVPSSVSAIKVDGVRSYARVHQGEDVKLAGRAVHVAEFKVLDVSRRMVKVADFARELSEELVSEYTPETMAPVIDVQVEVSVSSGTYVRALARDLGQSLGTGGYLTQLRRTRIGTVNLEHSVSLEELAEQEETNGQIRLISLEDSVRAIFPSRTLLAEEATDISFGRAIKAASEDVALYVAPEEPNNHPPVEGVEAVFAPDGTLVALVKNQKKRGKVLSFPLLVWESGKIFEDQNA